MDKCIMTNADVEALFAIYLFNRQPSGKLVIRKKGERSAPHGEFNVRGHFRHLKSGKVVWINEFKKGVGKHRNKTYKL